MVNWPPVSYPDWPPQPWIITSHLEFSGMIIAAKELRDFGFTFDIPTNAERQAYFNDANCSQGHRVTGRMLVSPDETARWPFAICSDRKHKELLTLWPPYSAGPLSGIE